MLASFAFSCFYLLGTSTVTRCKFLLFIRCNIANVRYKPKFSTTRSIEKSYLVINPTHAGNFHRMNTGAIHFELTFQKIE